MAQCVTRLRQVVKDCDYGEQAKNQIHDQVVQRCKSHELRKKLLEKENMENMEGRKDVNLVRDKQEDKEKESVKRACYRCGKVGHFGRDSECPAKGKTCHKCGGADHFGSQCRTKTAKPPKPRQEETKGKKKKSVRYVGSERDEDEYAFTLNSATSPEKIDVTCGRSCSCNAD